MMVRLNHRTKFDAGQVKETLGIAKTKLNTYKEMAEFLGVKKYTEQKLKEYMSSVFPVITQKEQSKKELSKSAARAVEIVEAQPGAEFARGTWWNAFNAVTFLTDHEIGRSNDTRLKSAWFGQNRNLKIKALETAVEYANAA